MPKFSILIIEDEKNIQTFCIKIKAKSDYPLKTPCFTAFQKG